MAQQNQQPPSTRSRSRPPDGSMALFRCAAIKCNPRSGLHTKKKKLLTFTWPVQDVRLIEERVMQTLNVNPGQGVELWWHMSDQHCLADARPFADLYVQSYMLQWRHQPGKSIHFHVHRQLQPGTAVAVRVFGKVCPNDKKSRHALTADTRIMTFVKPVASLSEVDESNVEKFYRPKHAETLWWHSEFETCKALKPLSALYTVRHPKTRQPPNGQTFWVHGLKSTKRDAKRGSKARVLRKMAWDLVGLATSVDEPGRAADLMELIRSFLDGRLRAYLAEQEARRSRVQRLGLLHVVNYNEQEAEQAVTREWQEQTASDEQLPAEGEGEDKMEIDEEADEQKAILASLQEA